MVSRIACSSDAYCKRSSANEQGHPQHAPLRNWPPGHVMNRGSLIPSLSGNDTTSSAHSDSFLSYGKYQLIKRGGHPRNSRNIQSTTLHFSFSPFPSLHHWPSLIEISAQLTPFLIVLYLFHHLAFLSPRGSLDALYHVQLCTDRLANRTWLGCIILGQKSSFAGASTLEKESKQPKSIVPEMPILTPTS